MRPKPVLTIGGRFEFSKQFRGPKWIVFKIILLHFLFLRLLFKLLALLFLLDILCLAFLRFLPLAALGQHRAEPVVTEGLDLLPAVGGDDGVGQGHADHDVDEEGDGEQGQDGEGGRVQTNRGLGGTVQKVSMRKCYSLEFVPGELLFE